MIFIKIIRGFLRAKLLTVREAESLLPDEVIETTLVEGDYPSTKIDVFEKVQRLDSDSNGMFRRYFDHKDGISLRQALDPNLIKFWKPHFSNERTLSVKSCYRNNICDNCGSCIQIEGFGDRILENAIEVMSRSNHRNLMSLLSGALKDEWESIGSKMVAWGCTPSPRRARAS